MKGHGQPGRIKQFCVSNEDCFLPPVGPTLRKKQGVTTAGNFLFPSLHSCGAATADSDRFSSSFSSSKLLLKPRMFQRTTLHLLSSPPLSHGPQGGRRTGRDLEFGGRKRALFREGRGPWGTGGGRIP
ncbi:hypothetical protein PoB_000730100 [Plakobranchus ocellatus]|uniref:Uncharacterized protein n=1 Tax=Plakobranchus ocellatus TaxID=259542 RepID=A0AAV3Y0M5_9GAST|nr:hypothetical protein PoB_000730100 [Plakobranchus ocellatus]